MPSEILINIISYCCHIQLICRIDDWGIMSLSPARTRDFYFLQSLQTGYAFYTASCLSGTRVPFFEGKVAKA